jgi:hypothetical protein
MADLEARLFALGPELEWPATPNVVPAIRSRLVADPRRRPSPAWRVAFAAAAAVVLTAGALLAIPSTRDAIAAFFHLQGLIIQRVPTNPTPAPSHGTTSIGDRLNLGAQVTLDQAQATAHFQIAVPRALGTPDAVYLLGHGDTQGVGLVYLPHPGLPQAAQTGVGALVIEFPGQVPRDYFAKMLGPDATLENVQVNGNAGYWISGKPHGLFFIDSHGNSQEDTFRLAGNTLIWDQAGLVIRIEAGVSKDQALQLATSMP